jgi:ATP-binding cassette subfamily B protein
VSLRWCGRYLQPYWPRLLVVVVLSLAGTAFSLVLPYFTKDLVDRALVGRDARHLVWITALFAGATLGSFVLNVVSGLQYTRASAEILFDMRLALYRHLQRLSPRFYARTPLGEIVSRINGDIAEIQRVAAEVALAWVGNALFLAGTLAIMLWLEARLFAVSVALLPACVWALAHYRRRLEARVGAVRQASSDIGSFLIETLQGMKLVAASNAEEREAARFRARNQNFIAALMSMQWATYLSGGLPGLILSASTALVFLYGGSLVIAAQLTLGSFVAFLAYHMRLLSPVQALMGLYTGLATARVSVGRVQQIFDTPPEVREQPGARELPYVMGRVEFDNVSFSFDRQPVLEKLHLQIEPGETVAIVGRSGSGKSTVADLLLRFLDPDEGVIRLDGHDLRSLRLADLRRHVALVEQEPFLFHATIAENLRYARPDATDTQLAEAARAAGILDFIEGLPQRFDTVAGERGLALSAGERQRLAIARAFLADAAVLVLDEPTAALDAETERDVMAGYERLMRGRTTIVITHRPEPAARAGRVVTLAGAS